MQKIVKLNLFIVALFFGMVLAQQCYANSLCCFFGIPSCCETPPSPPPPPPPPSCGSYGCCGTGCPFSGGTGCPVVGTYCDGSCCVSGLPFCECGPISGGRICSGGTTCDGCFCIPWVEPPARRGCNATCTDTSMCSYPMDCYGGINGCDGTSTCHCRNIGNVLDSTTCKDAASCNEPCGLNYRHVDNQNYACRNIPNGVCYSDALGREVAPYSYETGVCRNSLNPTSPTCVAAVNGACGTTATGSYEASESFPKGSLCSAGTVDSNPTLGTSATSLSSVSWNCIGSNGGTSVPCTATRACIPSVGSPTCIENTDCSIAGNCGKNQTYTCLDSCGQSVACSRCSAAKCPACNSGKWIEVPAN